MNGKRTTRTIVWIVILLLLNSTITASLAHPVGPQPGQEEEKKLREKQEKMDKKEAERKDKEAKSRSKEEKKYDTLREFAEDRYASDPDFHEEVDRGYRDLQSQHALEAYKINVNRTTELVSPETEDQTLKIRRIQYDNPWVQDYVNGVGQGLIPADSDKLYAFRVTYNPIPYAYTLSTGTILISTGMISLLDNEAQLAYVLAHELAHVYKNHWSVKIMMPLAEEEYNRRQEKKRAMWAGIIGAAGAVMGGAIKGGAGAVMGAGGGLLAGYVVGAIQNRKIGVDWEDNQENEADDFALKTVIERSYDAHEVPRLLANLAEVARFDERVELGFLGLRSRIKERTEHANRLLGGSLQPKYQELLKTGKMIGTSPDYNLVMAELKRDNGIAAYQFDMFEMARRNLKQAVSLRTDDARAAFYYGRVLKLVGRTREEKETAQQYLLSAIRLDTRRAIPEVQLQRALLLMGNKESVAQSEAAQAIKDYIISFQSRKADDLLQEANLPPNIDTLYDYLRLLGEGAWKAPTPELVRVSVPAGANAPSERQRAVRKNP